VAFIMEVPLDGAVIAFEWLFYRWPRFTAGRWVDDDQTQIRRSRGSGNVPFDGLRCGRRKRRRREFLPTHEREDFVVQL
jgi:hypothetical protein